jgi:hypothetical protein
MPVSGHRHRATVTAWCRSPRPGVRRDRPRGLGRLRAGRVSPDCPVQGRLGPTGQGPEETRFTPRPLVPRQVTWMPDHLPFRSGLVRAYAMPAAWRLGVGNGPLGMSPSRQRRKQPNGNWPHKCVPLMVLTPAHPEFPSRDARQQGFFHSCSGYTVPSYSTNSPPVTWSTWASHVSTSREDASAPAPPDRPPPLPGSGERHVAR